MSQSVLLLLALVIFIMVVLGIVINTPAINRLPKWKIVLVLGIVISTVLILLIQ
ncbi:uncharacterized protein (DUF983 family) [Pedobacter sp. UYP24]